MSKVLPTKKDRREELLNIPQQMTDPSYIDALAGMVQKAISHRPGGASLTGHEARELILSCIAEGVFRPAGWSENVR